MKRVASVISGCCFFISITIAQNLSVVENITDCGLGYAQSSVLLSQKLEFNGLPFNNGAVQPAAFVISGIPAGAKVLNAFVWWDITGQDTTGSVIVKNPMNVTDTFPGVLLGYDTVKCWGTGASAFRANINGIITGNGTYYLSGMPTDSVAVTTNDVNGATLFIIYKDTSATFTGTLLIYDGYVMVKQATIEDTLKGIPPPGIDTTATSFMLVSDLENITAPGPSKIKMNNGAYLTVTEEFWDFESKSTSVTQNQTSSIIGIQTPGDCANLIASGLYYRKSTNTTKPTISNNKDTLTLSDASGYQWFFNDSTIPGATGKVHVAKKDGVYKAVVHYGSGCYFSSDTLNVSLFVGIIEIGADNKVSVGIFPNPVSEKFTVILKNITGKRGIDIQLINMDGQYVYQTMALPSASGEAEKVIETNKFSEGIYLLRVVTESDLILKKVVLLR